MKGSLNKGILKFVFSDKKFYIDEEKKTIVCALKGEFVVNLGATNDKDTKMLLMLLSKYADERYYGIMNNIKTFSGKAVCRKEDKFDIIKGKRIAESKAKAQIYKQASKIALKTAEIVYDYFTLLNHIEMYYDGLYYKEKNHITELDNNKN